MRLWTNTSLTALISRITLNRWCIMAILIASSMLGAAGVAQGAAIAKESYSGDAFIAANAAISCFLTTLLACQMGYR